MTPNGLLLLTLITLAGAWLSASQEAREYHEQRKVSHLLLTFLRFTVAMLALRYTLPDPSPLPSWLMGLLFTAGIFGPTHRLLLNMIRIHRYEVPIPWYHLGTESKYDTLFRTLLMGSNKAAFITMSTFELLVSAAMYQQLQNQ